ncbi:hypothetical protein [Lysobacter gummosus]|uniref:hypothetical protein n=1 Tax=Lysobacter gummosus TaxID=262324 RepID=UPI0036339697
MHSRLPQTRRPRPYRPSALRLRRNRLLAAKELPEEVRAAYMTLRSDHARPLAADAR